MHVIHPSICPSTSKVQPAELTMKKWAYFDTGIIWEGGSWCFEFSFWYQIRSSTSKGWKMSIFKIHLSGGLWQPAELTMNKWAYFDTGIIWEGGSWCFEFSFWYCYNKDWPQGILLVISWWYNFLHLQYMNVQGLYHHITLPIRSLWIQKNCKYIDFTTHYEKIFFNFG